MDRAHTSWEASRISKVMVVVEEQRGWSGEKSSLVQMAKFLLGSQTGSVVGSGTGAAD